MNNKIISIILAFYFITSFAFAQSTITSNDQWTPVSRQDATGITMVQVPAGSFVMGSSKEEVDYALQICNEAKREGECESAWIDDELDGGTQTFTEPFWIDETEVTRAAFTACVNEGVCTKPLANEYSSSDNQPINNVSWQDAATYCAWRGARLPTEAEWEYAARGPDGLIFPWGNSFVGDEANHCDSNCAKTSWASAFPFLSPDDNDGYSVTAPVGSYPKGASWVGALDMAGNVWEWTRSYHEAYPFKNDGRNIPEDEKSVSGDIVMQGGSFVGALYGLRSANRGGDGPDINGINDGFRCVRSNVDF